MSQRTKSFSVPAWHNSLQLLQEQLMKLTQQMSSYSAAIYPPFCCYLLYFSHLLNTLLTVIWHFTPYLFGYIKALHFQGCQSIIFTATQLT